MRNAKSRKSSQDNAYILYLRVRKDLALKVGVLGPIVLSAGSYAYVGSACGSIQARVSRHRRLAESKTGKIHWHIDHVLVHPDTELTRIKSIPGCSECSIAQSVAARPGATVPAPGFGSTDCMSGCPAHLFRLRNYRPTSKVESHNAV
ncbi:MAG: GIY-YIG nuclease family protein [Acidobacteriota bacterium]